VRKSIKIVQGRILFGNRLEMAKRVRKGNKKLLGFISN
jgi:hypothetical protein